MDHVRASERQARALEERGNDYLLLVRLDDTELPGIPPTIGYLSTKRHRIAEIADVIVRKLSA